MGTPLICTERPVPAGSPYCGLKFGHEGKHSWESRLLELTDKVFEKIMQFGTITAIGGSVYSGGFEYLCCTSELYEVKMELLNRGYSLSRTDSGGNPTWVLNSAN
jgi:hypothetical protein